MDFELNILLRVTVAMVLSGILGWEREAAGKSAGVRTHMLVGLGAALFVILGELFVQHFDTGTHQPQMRFDPIRVIEAVVTGVSFLGAGTIFVSRGKESVKGLTTAASILVTAAVGMIAGLEFYLLAACITAMIFFVLHALGWVKEKLLKRRQPPSEEA